MSACTVDVAVVTLAVEFAIAFVGLSRTVLAAPSVRFRLNLA